MLIKRVIKRAICCGPVDGLLIPPDSEETNKTVPYK